MSRRPSFRDTPHSHPRAECAGCHFDEATIGRIEGKLDMIHEGQKAQANRMDSIDARLRSVENRSAVAGAIGGSVVSILVSLIGLRLGKA